MDVSASNIWFAFGITLFAGLSTGIGGALAFFAKRTNTKFLSGALGFSAGVMIYVSFVEILKKASESLTTIYGVGKGGWITLIGFFAGIGLIALIDNLVPNEENPHEMRDVEEMEMGPDEQAATSVDSEVAKKDREQQDLYRTGVFSALAIAIHNFPEGLATFMAALYDPALGLSIAVAIAIHNIPEGIAVAVPIYYATGSRRKAFVFSFLSGLSEPLGALLGYTLLRRFISETMFGIVFALVAGIMVYISLDELLPAAEKYGHHHTAIYGVIAGMAVMAVSLLVLG